MPKSGIAANITTYMRDEPVESLGCGDLSLYQFVGTVRTVCVVDQVANNTPLGDIMMINIENLVVAYIMGHSVE